MSKNKDRKAKKRETEAKLRQHVESGVEEVLSSPTILTNLPATTTAVLAASSNPRDAAALYFIQQQQQRAAQLAQQQAYAQQNAHDKRSRDEADHDEDADEHTANNESVLNARIAMLTAQEASSSTTKANANNNQSKTNTNGINNEEEQPRQPKRKRFRQEEMKLALEKALGTLKGARLVPFVDEHTGNAPEPFICVQLKSNPHNVSVPAHWTSISAYLSSQTDRPPAKVILPEVEASGVAYVRSGKNSNPDVRLFARAFLNGNPLEVKTYNTRLTEKGATYEGRKWRPTTTITPGKISEDLRKALGMLTPNSPPPWIYAMQRARCLPPSYPNASFVGLNAPIPEGAQWGFSRGQWGEPVRKEDGTFMFPAVQSLGGATQALPSSSSTLSSSAKNALRPFGTVPPRRRADTGAKEGTAEEKDNASHTLINPSATAKKATPVVADTFGSAAAAVAAATAASKPKVIVPHSVQLEQYLMEVAVEEDDLLSAGARLVTKKGTDGATPHTAAGVGINLH